MAKKPPRKKPAPMDMRVTVPIKRQIPEDVTTVFSNHFAVQSEKSVSYLLFFQLQSPLIIGDDAQKQEQIAALDHVSAKCVLRVVVPSDQMPSIIEAMHNSFQKV